MKPYLDVPLKKAKDAMNRSSNPSLTEQLLYAILTQLESVNEQLDEIAERKS